MKTEMIACLIIAGVTLLIRALPFIMTDAFHKNAQSKFLERLSDLLTPALIGMLVVYCLKRRQPCIRVGITTGKKVGNAVRRSRARRVIREAYRHLIPQDAAGWDIIFVARTRTALVKEQAVEESMKLLLENAGVI